jgi:hypothetical protein
MPKEYSMLTRLELVTALVDKIDIRYFTICLVSWKGICDISMVDWKDIHASFSGCLKRVSVTAPLVD